MSVAQRRPRTAGMLLVLAGVALMWLLEIVDVLTRHALDGLGIRPRELDGLVGVPIAPLLHFGFAHLMANTVPLVVLGLIVALGGVLRVVAVSVIVTVVSGAGVWLLSPATSVTAGASGLVFGYAAYLVARGAMSRRLAHMVVGVVVLVVYGTGLLSGLLPQAGVSWQGHLFGAVGGVLAAWLLQPPR